MEEKFICKFCGREFKVNYALTYHQNRCKNNPNRIVNKPTYTKHHKKQCQYCGKEIDVANLDRHEKACSDPNSKLNIKKQINYKITHCNEDLTCFYCGQKCKNKNSLMQHQCRCKLNPERREFNNLSNYITNNRKGKTKDNCPEIEKQVNTMKIKYEMGYTHPNTGFGYGFKCGWYKGIWCDSSWELAFVMYQIDNGIEIQRNQEAFEYIGLDGNKHNYYPDFIIDDVFYEIKGIVDETAKIKIKAVEDQGKQIFLLDESNIKMFKQYAENTYGTDYYNLYDPSKKSWKDYVK